jgi:ABC-2 type transport system permease protein/ribosome-dependent ATPase
MKLRRILTLARKEVREILRDRLYAMLAFLLPSMLLVVFAYGMKGDVENIGLLVVDEDQSQASRAYSQQFLATRHFRLVAASQDPALIERALSNNQARVALWIGPDFERNLRARRPVEVAALIDAAVTAPARTIRAYLEAINAQANAGYRLRAAAAQSGPRAMVMAQAAQPVRLATRFLYNPEVRSIVMVAPSLIMVVLMLVPPLLIAVSVVREKESGAIYNIASSTVTRTEFLLGKLLPVVAICMINAVIVWLIVCFYFDVTFRGSPVQFAFAVLLYILATVGLGLLVSAAVRTQQAAIIITTISALIIAIQFAGFFAPLDTAEPANRFLARLFPAGYFLPVVRGMYLKGAGIAEYWRELLALALYAVIVLGLAHALFHKRTKS